MSKRQKLGTEDPDVPVRCQFFVKRKKRFCKMTVKAGNKFCGEHLIKDSEDKSRVRIPCPLDLNHSVCRSKLDKHLLICNARKKENLPGYVSERINIGEPEDGEDEKFQLKDIPQDELDVVIRIVNRLFDEHVADKIQSEIKTHKVLDEEVSNKSYGDGKLRHLLQTASVIGILDERGFFKKKTCFIDLGAGKGNLSFWLSKAIEDENLENSKVLVIDRASHRHKKDNLIKDRSLVERIRVDIADLNLNNLDFGHCESVVGVSKHLCGRATDYALRCLMNCKKTKGFLICVCCHHQITYNSFLGREWLTLNNINRRTFNIIAKMVSWCICGDGRSREDARRDENDEKRKEKEEIGWKCKRILDFARVEYLNKHGFEANLSFYVDKSQTLENICIVGKIKTVT